MPLPEPSPPAGGSMTGLRSDAAAGPRPAVLGGRDPAL